MTMDIYIEAINTVMETDFGASDLDKSLTSISEWDSLSALGLMAHADETFGVVLTPTVLENAETLGDLVNALKS